MISKVFNFNITDKIYSLFHSGDVSAHITSITVPSALFLEESKEQLCTKLINVYCFTVQTLTTEKNVFIRQPHASQGTCTTKYN